LTETQGQALLDLLNQQVLPRLDAAGQLLVKCGVMLEAGALLLVVAVFFLAYRRQV
jgi:hypothetical protein